MQVPSPSSSPGEETAFDEKTQLSKNFLSQNISLLAQTALEVAGKKALTVDDLLNLPLYPPGLPLSTQPIQTSTASPNQPDEAVLTGLLYTSNKNGSPQLPNISIDNWDLDGQEQMFVLLPKYLFANCIIVLQAFQEATEKLKKELKNNKMLLQILQRKEQEILEAIRVLEFVFHNLEKRGKQIIELMRKGQQLQEEISKQQEATEKLKKELIDTYQQVQMHVGQFQSITFKGSYYHQLTTIRPLLKQISSYYENFPKEVNYLTAALIAGNDVTAAPRETTKVPVNRIKQHTAAAIILILSAVTGAAVTATCCNHCNRESSTQSVTLDK